MRTPLLLSTYVPGGTALAQIRQPVKPADAYRISTLTDPQVAPGGKWIAYSMSDVISVPRTYVCKAGMVRSLYN